jgi:hypothetical protein
MTQSHFMYITFKNFRNVIDRPTIKCPKIKENIKNLCIIYALSELLKDNSANYESGYFLIGTGSLILDAQKHMMTVIRPQIVSLIEAFGIPDSILCSAIGNSYGDIYET